jgi:hypothetical protein
VPNDDGDDYYFSFEEELSEILSKMFIGLNVKCPLFLSDFNDN